MGGDGAKSIYQNLSHFAIWNQEMILKNIEIFFLFSKVNFYLT